MPTFSYKAVSPRGETLSGRMDAPDEGSIVARLQAQGKTPLLVAPDESTVLSQLLNTEIAILSGISRRAVLEITQALATLLMAGISLDKALVMVRDTQSNDKRRGLVESLLQTVKEGDGFAAALEAHPRVFSPFYRSMVRAGEAGASIGAVLSRLATHLEASQKTRRALSSALIYPAFLIVAAIAAVAILLTVVVPTFAPMFEDAGAALPASTAIVIAVGGFFQAYWWALIGAAAAAMTAFIALNTNPAGKLWWHGLALHIPIVGTAWCKASYAQVARTLGVLLENGVPLPQAMALARDVSGNARIAADVANVAKQADLGRGLAAPFKAGKIMPPLALQLIEVGEETGKLPPMLHKLADIYEEETKLAMERFLAVLVPVLTLVIGLLIAFIVSSILFALFSINELAR